MASPGCGTKWLTAMQPLQCLWRMRALPHLCCCGFVAVSLEALQPTQQLPSPPARGLLHAHCLCFISDKYAAFQKRQPYMSRITQGTWKYLYFKPEKQFPCYRTWLVWIYSYYDVPEREKMPLSLPCYSKTLERFYHHLPRLFPFIFTDFTGYQGILCFNCSVEVFVWVLQRTMILEGEVNRERGIWRHSQAW